MHSDGARSLFAPRTYSSIDDVWQVAASELNREGAVVEGRNGGTFELQSACFRIGDIDRAWLTSGVRKASRAYACAELLWYLSGSNDGAVMTAYADKYAGFLNDGKAYGAYGRRWGEYSQLESVITLLRKQASTRQAVCSTWHPVDVSQAVTGLIKDIPCTLTQQFLLREGRCNMIVSMRSNDWWLGMPYDVFCFSQILRVVAAAVGAKPGWYEHRVGSLHAYEQDAAHLVEAMEEKPETRITLWNTIPLGVKQIYDWPTLKEQVAIAVAEETRIRNRDGALHPRPEVIDLLGGPDQLLAHAVSMCALKIRSRTEKGD